VVMYAGRKIEEATVDDLFAAPLHPYTVGLLASVPRLASLNPDAPKLDRLQEIPGMVPPLTRLPAGCTFAPRCPRADAKCHATYPPFHEHRPAHAAACWHPHG